jgi:hypothetical protein
MVTIGAHSAPRVVIDFGHPQRGFGNDALSH